MFQTPVTPAVALRATQRAQVGGGNNSLVGASGGVYCIFGMHFAELLLNWDSLKYGPFNRWRRLFVMTFLLAADLFSYYKDRNEEVSYTAHSGGWLAGCMLGVVLMRNHQKQWYETHLLVPSAMLLASLLIAFGVLWYIFIFPPRPAFWSFDDTPCCYEMLRCTDLDKSDYSKFTCVDDTEIQYNGVSLDRCTEYEAYAR